MKKEHALKTPETKTDLSQLPHHFYICVLDWLPTTVKQANGYTNITNFILIILSYAFNFKDNWDTSKMLFSLTQQEVGVV